MIGVGVRVRIGIASVGDAIFFFGQIQNNGIEINDWI